jgi:hypothetical protein
MSLKKAPSPADSDDDDAASNEMEIHTSLGPNDVLLGRGGWPSETPGNTKFRTLIKDMVKRLNARVGDGGSRAHIVQKIVEIIKERGGKFLQKGNGYTFTVVDDAIAKDKTRQSLRRQIRIFEQNDDDSTGKATTGENNDSSSEDKKEPRRNKKRRWRAPQKVNTGEETTNTLSNPTFVAQQDQGSTTLGAGVALLRAAALPPSSVFPLPRKRPNRSPSSPTATAGSNNSSTQEGGDEASPPLSVRTASSPTGTGTAARGL